MALRIAQLRSNLLAAGWKVLTSDAWVVERLGNKARLRDFAERVGLLGHLPEHYASLEGARYPCVLKAALGEHGRDIHIVRSREEARAIVADHNGSEWLLQELVLGCIEYSVSLLVESGNILDAICTRYEYDREEYVWPRAEEVSKEFTSDIPPEHMAVMAVFLSDYSGICNFNYKVREGGSMAIFEVNTRVGADLACDVPRERARALFERLDELSSS